MPPYPWPRSPVADVSQNPLQPPTNPLSWGMLLEAGYEEQV